MKIQVTILLGALFLAGPVYAADNQARIGQLLESVSAHIGEHTDAHAVADSLYHQIREHVRITRHELKRAEIDQRVHSYIAKKYTPILLLKYSEAFRKMQQANAHFSSCHHLEPFKFSAGVMTAMCTVNSRGTIQVRYLVNEGKKGWEKTSDFVFRPENHSLRLVAIKLHLRKHQKVHVDGI